MDDVFDAQNFLLMGTSSSVYAKYGLLPINVEVEQNLVRLLASFLDVQGRYSPLTRNLSMCVPIAYL